MELEKFKARVARRLTAYGIDKERAEAGEKRYALTSADLGKVAELVETARFFKWDDIIPDCFIGCDPATMAIKTRKR